MSDYPVDVMGSGAVLLGDEVVCDGFHRQRRVRVQTHVHDDHMTDFETSKGFQDLLMSEATHRLLAAEFNADLHVRENIYALAPHASRKVGACSVTLIPSGHMLGAMQVLVETSEGVRLGYSGDFRWPLDEEDIMKCEALVVDSTYGNPDRVREYTQEDAESCFLALVLAKLKVGSVHLDAHRGTIQRAVQLLGGNVAAPILASERLCKEIKVYQWFGSAIATIVPLGSPDARQCIAQGRYIRLYSKGDKRPAQLREGTRITLSAYMAKKEHPVLEFSDRAYKVAMSNHADFFGTLEYIRATEAKYVVTDNTRTYGIDLARAIQERLGIQARPSTNVTSYDWGA